MHEASTDYWQRVTILLTQRDQIVEEILVHHRAGRASPLLKKAEALLTRFWARADWQAREELLRSATWLLNVGRGQAAGVPAFASKAGGRRGVRSKRAPSTALAAGAGGDRG